MYSNFHDNPHSVSSGADLHILDDLHSLHSLGHCVKTDLKS